MAILIVGSQPFLRRHGNWAIALYVDVCRIATERNVLTGEVIGAAPLYRYSHWTGPWLR